MSYLGAHAKSVVLKTLAMHQNHLESLLKYRLLGSTPTVSDSVGSGLSQRICISNSFQMMLFLQGPHLENYCTP